MLDFSFSSAMLFRICYGLGLILNGDVNTAALNIFYAGWEIFFRVFMPIACTKVGFLAARTKHSCKNDEIIQ